MIKLYTTLFVLLISFFGFSQTIENPLQTERTIKFDSKKYDLVWSSHPNQNYYKQEYLTKGQSLESFKSMLIIDFIKGDFTVEDAVNAKINELENAKKTNPVVNYTKFEKDGEVILDFLLSANSKDGSEIVVVERNVYRYLKIESKENSGILIFAVSERAYKNEIEDFFKKLKETKSVLINEVGNFEIPKINPKG